MLSDWNGPAMSQKWLPFAKALDGCKARGDKGDGLQECAPVHLLEAESVKQVLTSGRDFERKDSRCSRVVTPPYWHRADGAPNPNPRQHGRIQRRRTQTNVLTTGLSSARGRPADPGVQESCVRAG